VPIKTIKGGKSKTIDEGDNQHSDDNGVKCTKRSKKTGSEGDNQSLSNDIEAPINPPALNPPHKSAKTNKKNTLDVDNTVSASVNEVKITANKKSDKDNQESVSNNERKAAKGSKKTHDLPSVPSKKDGDDDDKRPMSDNEVKGKSSKRKASNEDDNQIGKDNIKKTAREFSNDKTIIGEKNVPHEKNIPHEKTVPHEKKVFHDGMIPQEKMALFEVKNGEKSSKTTAPTRGLTPYALFCAEEKPLMVDQNPSMPLADLTKLLSARYTYKYVFIIYTTCAYIL
jgi:hypothetical protein